jgi:hypothetical protein
MDAGSLKNYYRVSFNLTWPDVWGNFFFLRIYKLLLFISVCGDFCYLLAVILFYPTSMCNVRILTFVSLWEKFFVLLSVKDKLSYCFPDSLGIVFFYSFIISSIQR